MVEHGAGEEAVAGSWKAYRLEPGARLSGWKDHVNNLQTALHLIRARALNR